MRGPGGPRRRSSARPRRPSPAHEAVRRVHEVLQRVSVPATMTVRSSADSAPSMLRRPSPPGIVTDPQGPSDRSSRTSTFHPSQPGVRSSSACTSRAKSSVETERAVSIPVTARSSASTLARAVVYSGGSGRRPSLRQVRGPPGKTCTPGPRRARRCSSGRARRPARRGGTPCRPAPRGGRPTRRRPADLDRQPADRAPHHVLAAVPAGQLLLGDPVQPRGSWRAHRS